MAFSLLVSEVTLEFVKRSYSHYYYLDCAENCYLFYFSRVQRSAIYICSFTRLDRMMPISGLDGIFTNS